MTMVLTELRVIDGRGGPPIENGVVVIEGGKITQLGRAGEVAVPPQAAVRSLPGCTALPGLIDLHVHITDATVGRQFGPGELSERALMGARNAYHALRSGVTTVRDVGSVADTSLSVREAIARGHIPGPRLFTSGQYLVIEGGHGTEHAGAARLVNSPQDAVKAVRERIRAGADWIKMMNNSQLSVREFTHEEMRAIVTEAHRLGKKVACHASVLPAVKSALDAGVDTIEHGSELDEACVEQMARQGVVLVPTLVALRRLQEHLDQVQVDDRYKEAVGQRWAAVEKAMPLALEAGVRIATGTDAGMWPVDFHDIVTEMQLLVEFGMSPLQAITAATLEGARVLGIDDRVGVLAPGYAADILVVEGDPSRDVSTLSRVRMVLQNGEPIPALQTVA